MQDQIRSQEPQPIPSSQQEEVAQQSQQRSVHPQSPQDAQQCFNCSNAPCGSSPLSFLRNLIPRDFDTADLIVVLLLLLIAGDNAHDRNNALLTMALYLFL